MAAASGASSGAPAAAAGAPVVPTRNFKLSKESELRVEVGWDAPLRMQLLSGAAEIFGTEMPPSNWVTFPPAHKFAVFTWNGAVVEMEGEAEVAYTADETPMVSYVNCHAVLERRRKYAKEMAQAPPPAAAPNQQRPDVNPDSYGPRVMVVGPSDSGKSSLAKILLGWAARQGWKPIFVDLDVGQGAITIPGTIAATPIEMPIDPVEGVPLDVPLVHYFGHASPSVNQGLYGVLVKELARTLEAQTSANPDARAAGMVINTMGWVDGVGYELLLQAIEAFNASVILVLGQEKLYNMLQQVLKGKQGVDVVKLHKSGGVVARNTKYRQKTRMLKTKEYFYGINAELSPHLSVSNFNELQIFRIGGGPQAPRSALPIGAEPTADPTRVVPVSINRDLIHAVLAVSYAKDPEHLLTSNVAGFLHVTDVDLPRRKISYIAPCPGPLPNNLMLVGSLTWVE